MHWVEFFFVFLTEPEASNSASNIQKVIKNADDLYKTHKFEELYSYMQQFIDFENDEILWRLARATMEKSKLTEDKTLRKQLVYNAFDITKRALALNENNFACHKVCLYFISLFYLPDKLDVSVICYTLYLSVCLPERDKMFLLMNLC